MRRIILFLHENPFLKEKIENMRKEFRDVSFVEKSGVNNLDDILEKTEGIVTGRFTRELSEKTPNLKITFASWTGVDNIDFRIVRERNLIVANTKSHAKIVAEKAVLLFFPFLEGLWSIIAI